MYIDFFGIWYYYMMLVLLASRLVHSIYNLLKSIQQIDKPYDKYYDDYQREQ